MLRKADGTFSKTVLVNALVATLGTLVGLVPQLQAAINPEWYPWAFVGLSVVYQFLRQVTSQPMA